MVLFIYFAILFGLTAVILVLTRTMRVFPGVVAAAGSYWVFMAAGTYHIFISRGSTAGIGFLFIPVYSLLPALVGAVGVAVARQPAIGYKILGGLILTAWLPMAGFTLHGIIETRQTNAERDAQVRAQREAYLGYQKQLREQPDRYTAQTLLERLETKPDRAFFLAVASWKETPDAVLEKLVDQDDGGVLLSLLRHPRTPMAAIEKAVRLNERHYFSYDLAANPKTPKAVLLSLVMDRSRPVPMGRALMQNPNADCDALRTYLKTEPGSMTRYQEKTPAMVRKRVETDCP
jgi:hypothetical protein